MAITPLCVFRRVDVRFSFALTFFAFLDALCYPLITIGLGDAPHLTFAFLRAVLAGSLLGLVAVLLRRPLPQGVGTWFGLAGIGLGTTSLGFAGMFHAAEFVTPGTATIIAHSQPLIAAILAYWFLGERLHYRQRIGLLLAFVGIVTISLPQLIGVGNATFAVGLAYIVLATIGVAIGNVLMKALGGRVDPLVGMAAQLLLGAVPLAIAAALQERPVAITWSPTFLASLLALALFSTALARSLWFILLKQVPLSRANAFTFLSPFIAIALGVAFFGESFGLFTLLGLAFTTGGIVLVEQGSTADGQGPPSNQSST
jgi:drug/metabolite transporter (DMT)-like permease